MNRFKILAITLFSAIICSCTNDDGVTSNDLTILSGISGNKLMLEAAAGVSSKFSFRANYDWSIIDYQGFSCDPSSGYKTVKSQATTVTATPLSSNNTGDTLRLSDLNFKLKNTRIVGISAHQLPHIIAETRNVSIESTQGSRTTVTFKTKCNIDDIDLIVSNDNLAASITQSDKVGAFTRYTITITALKSNTLIEDITLGYIEFKVNGIVQERLKINVIQKSAISFDRSCVILPGYNGGENLFCVNSKYDVELSYDSDKFSVTSYNENKTYLVKALVDNNSDKQVLLGSIDVKLKDAPDTYNTIDVYQQRAKASQTIMIYFVGTSLSTYYKSNIEKMLEALNANIQYDARILATFTNASTDATLYEFRYDNILGRAVKEKVKEISLSTPYKATTLEDILRNMKEFAPADKYSLIFGSHGHGWTSKYFVETQSSRLKKMGYSTSPLLWQKPENALTRHIGDGDRSVQYDIEEIATATVATDLSFEYIIFDACFMGNIESAYALRNVTKHIVGSTCEIMGAGFPYAKVTKYMLTNNGTSYDLDKICKEFVNHYKTDNSVGVRSACVSITNTAELEALAVAMKKVNNAAVNDNFTLENVQFYDGINSTYNPVHIFYDLGDLVAHSCADTNIASEFKAQLQKCVTSRYHTDSFYSAYDGAYYKINSFSGTTTSAMVHFCSDEWKNTEWYKATH